MTGAHQNDTDGATASKPPVEDDHVKTVAARVGGRDTEPPAARPELIKTEAGRPKRAVPMTTEEWIARHLATAPRISDERWARIDAVFAVMEDQQRSASVRPPRPESE